MSVDEQIKNYHLPQTNKSNSTKNDTEPQNNLNPYSLLGRQADSWGKKKKEYESLVRFLKEYGIFLIVCQ